MLDKIEVARYFLSLDDKGIIFNNNLIERNGRTFYEGNAKLNKLMHLAQNIYFAKTGQLLIDADFFAYDNGAVVPEVQENYMRLLTSGRKADDGVSGAERDFLRRIYFAFKDAPLEELIEIDHEDPEWKKKHLGFSKQEQRMDVTAHPEDYKKRYEDIIILLDKMEME